MILNVKIKRILYPQQEFNSDEDTWYILSTDQGICKGKVYFRPKEYQELSLDGDWTLYKGEKQFSFQSSQSDIPKDLKTYLFYACEITPGLGEKTAQKIWDELGESWTERLSECLKDKKLVALQEVIQLLENDKNKTAVITFLKNIGSTTNMALSAWEKWEDKTIGIVQNNCYKLAELPHYGFTHIDQKIRKFFDISDSDERRIEAAILYSIKIIANGSTLVSWEELKECIIKNGIPVNLAAKQTKKMFNENNLIGFDDTREVALFRHYRDENIIRSYINAG